MVKEPFLDDFQMEQPKETAAEAEAEGGAAFGFKAEACVVLSGS